MTMYYDDRDYRIMKQTMHDRLEQLRRSEVDREQRIQKTEKLRQKPIPVKKSD
jgi:hypothetical protein